MPADAADGMLCLLMSLIGSCFRRAALSMNCPAAGESVLMWKRVKCGFVKKAGPLQLLFRPLIQDFTWRLMKPNRMPLYCLYFATLLPAGSMKNFLYLRFALNPI